MGRQNLIFFQGPGTTLDLTFLNFFPTHSNFSLPVLSVTWTYYDFRPIKQVLTKTAKNQIFDRPRGCWDTKKSQNDPNLTFSDPLQLFPGGTLHYFNILQFYAKQAIFGKNG